MDFKETVTKIVNDEKLLNLLCNLDSRWNDEKEYEDWKEYSDLIKSNVEFIIFDIDYKFVKATKRPFGLVIEIENVKVNFFLKKSRGYVNLAAKVVK